MVGIALETGMAEALSKGIQYVGMSTKFVSFQIRKPDVRGRSCHWPCSRRKTSSKSFVGCHLKLLNYVPLTPYIHLSTTYSTTFSQTNIPTSNSRTYLICVVAPILVVTLLSWRLSWFSDRNYECIRDFGRGAADAQSRRKVLRFTRFSAVVFVTSSYAGWYLAVCDHGS